MSGKPMYKKYAVSVFGKPSETITGIETASRAEAKARKLVKKYPKSVVCIERRTRGKPDYFYFLPKKTEALKTKRG